MNFEDFRRLIACLIAVGLCIVPDRPAIAAGVEIEQMTWIEVRDAIQAGATTVIVPTGGTEQNGPHMVTGKHNFIVALAAKRIAFELGDALAAPVLAYTPEGDVAKREGHTAYPGTISISESAFEGVLEGAARSFSSAGFRLIVFLGDSGPNQAGQERVSAKLSAELAQSGVRVVSAKRYYAGEPSIELLLGEGETRETIGVHAGIRDTSELMSVWPAGVRMERLGAGGAAGDRLGADGDARKATAERGARLLALRIAAAVEEIRAAKSATLSPPLPRGWLDWLSPKQ